METLQRVQREVRRHDRQLLRQSLRLIRLPWVWKWSRSRNWEMRNLLRLCAVRPRRPNSSADRVDAAPSTRGHRHNRWRKVDRSMPKILAPTTKAPCFLDWIRLVKNTSSTTPWSRMLLKRSTRLHVDALAEGTGARRAVHHQDRWADLRAVFVAGPLRAYLDEGT